MSCLKRCSQDLEWYLAQITFAKRINTCTNQTWPCDSCRMNPYWAFLCFLASRFPSTFAHGVILVSQYPSDLCCTSHFLLSLFYRWGNWVLVRSQSRAYNPNIFYCTHSLYSPMPASIVYSGQRKTESISFLHNWNLSLRWWDLILFSLGARKVILGQASIAGNQHYEVLSFANASSAICWMMAKKFITAVHQLS